MWPADNSQIEQEILDVLHQHRLTPLFSYQVNLTDSLHDSPSMLLSELKDAAKQETVIEMVQEEELKHVLAAMEMQGVTPLLIKGTPLSFNLYPAKGLRPRCDTDLLIPKEQGDKVSALMRDMGYEPLFEEAGEFLSSQTSFSKKGMLGVTHSFDVHRQISNASLPFSRVLNYKDLMVRSVGIPILGSNARTLENIDALLLACFHRAGHFSYEGERLIWLYDIHLLSEVLSEEGFERFYERAKALQIVQICADAIFSAQEWFDTRLSERTVAMLHLSTAPEESIAYLETGRLSGIKKRTVLEAKGLSSWREKFQLFYEKLFPSADYMIWRYGIKRKYLLPFYYVYRFFYGIYVFVKG